MAQRPVIICDTREQRPYGFPSGRVEVVRAGLPAGDYSVSGLEDQVAVERKSLADLVNTVVGDRDRWKRELDKLKGYRFAAVIVEACIHDVLSGRWHGGAQPNTVLQAVVAVMTDYRIPVLLAGDRATAERMVEAMILRTISGGSGNG